MYRDTKQKDYLGLARNIARFILSNPAIPEDRIPYWDYSVAGPGTPRDASSAAITASALLELAGMVGKKEGRQYIAYAEEIIQSLSSLPYKAAIGTNGGFILKHSTGNLPQDREIDVPLSYADYYYVETLIRYKNLLVRGSIR
jgi:unsaturated chondroitin disaccharide hydrolase